MTEVDVTGPRPGRIHLLLRNPLGPQHEPVQAEIGAEIYGNWAVHGDVQLDTAPGSLLSSPIRATITHVPSGLQAEHGLKFDAARIGARALAKELNVEAWGPDGSDQSINNSRQLSEILRRHGVPTRR